MSLSHSGEEKIFQGQNCSHFPLIIYCSWKGRAENNQDSLAGLGFELRAFLLLGRHSTM
jgi:hypothetical protein